MGVTARVIWAACLGEQSLVFARVVNMEGLMMWMVIGDQGE